MAVSPPVHDATSTTKPEVEWRETDKEGVHDLFVNGRIIEYDVPERLRDDALRRARIKP